MEGADKISCLYVVMPWGKRLQSGHNFVDPFTELHEISVVIGSVGDCAIHALKSRLCTTVREIAPMVGDEGLRSISSRESLKEVNNCFFDLCKPMLMSLNEERSTRVKVSQFLCRVELVLDANLVLPHSAVSGRGLNVVVWSAVHAVYS